MARYVYLRVSRKGEVYLLKELREKAGIKAPGYVKAYVINGKLVIEPVETLEDILAKPKKIKLTVEEFEKLSLEAQGEILGGEENTT